MKLICLLPFVLILISSWTHQNNIYPESNLPPNKKIKKENPNLQLLRNIPWADPKLLAKMQGC
jgi:hypothetical protein